MDTVKTGSQGADVELLQTALVRAGYLSDAIDGVFGSHTQNAVISFQRNNALVQDGIAGINTWSAIMPYITGYVRHYIRKGDSLYKIATANNSSVEAIIAANPGIDPQKLQIGQMITVPFEFNVVPVDVSFTYDVLLLCLEGLLARYPFLTAEIIGSTYYGRDIYLVYIGGGKNKVHYNASHHGNEWITTPVLMKFLEDYAKAYAFKDDISGISASLIYEASTIAIAPMINPDGVDLVTGGIKKGSSQYEAARKLSLNYPNIPFPSGWKANLSGVDLNLNYPASWENAKEIKYAQGYTLPGPRDFVGDAPLTQPESIALYRFTLHFDPKLVLAYHTQGQVIYWQFQNYESPDAYEIANELSRLSGYLVDNTPYESSFAGYKDWFLQQYQRPGYTIEAGLGINPLPISRFNKIYNDNLPILIKCALL